MQPHLSPEDTARLARVSMLLDGRTRVLRAGPHLVEALVFLLDGGRYRLGYRAGAWWCQCGSPRPPCGHVRALQLVTMPEGPGRDQTRDHDRRARPPDLRNLSNGNGSRRGDRPAMAETDAHRGTGMSDAETVELLWQVFTAGAVPDPADPGTWRVRGRRRVRLLTLAELHRVRTWTSA